MNFSFVHEFDIDPAGYWKIFLASDFNKDLFAELKMKKYEVLEQKDDGKHFHRRQICEPSTPIPGFLQSLVKSTGYTEIDEMEWGSNIMQIKIETAMLKDRFSMSGSYIVTPLDGGKRARREFKGEVKVTVPLIGGRIEKFMMEQLRDSYDIAARVTRRWIEKQKTPSA
jgi:hypothetical protein